MALAGACRAVAISLLMATGIKLMLVPSYRSTDFEVHRNWLAVTSSKPISEWYLEDTSEWTLDYPPFFAWFERVLAVFARHADPSMLEVTNLNYASRDTVLFQRGSVMVTDTVLAGAVVLCSFTMLASQGHVSGAAAALSAAHHGPEQRAAALSGLIIGSAGLLLVDHIHFQYNGMLMGIFLASITLAEQKRYLACGLAFATLINFKHLYMYCAPVFFMGLLRGYCCAGAQPRLDLVRLFLLGSLVLAVFGLSLGPVIATGQLGSLVSRLFPFGRGLCHAYWAPNAWALYAGADKVLAAVLPRLGYSVAPGTANLTSGLVGAAKFAVLPQVEPIHTALAVLLAQGPALWRLWSRPGTTDFCHTVAYASLSAFMFGFHVHEKAALTVTLPMAMLAIRSPDNGRQYVFTSTVAHFALMPLIFTPDEYFIKVLLVLGHFLLSLSVLRWWHGRGTSLLSTAEAAYLAGLVPLELYCAAGHRMVLGDRLPFLPLMAISLYCAAGMTYSWTRLLLRLI